MGDDSDHGTWLETVTRRVEFIELLDREGPLSPRDVVDALDYSRSTVTRALRELRETDIVEQGPDGYTTTLAGVMAADEFRRYETASRAIFAARGLLASIPDAHAPPVGLLADADTILAEAETPVRALEAVSDRVQEARTVRMYLPTLVNTHLLRIWHRTVVASSVDGEGLFDPDLLTVLKGQYPHLLAEMAATDRFSGFATTGPPYGVILTTTGETTTVAVVVYEDDTAIRGVLINDAAEAVEWARTTLDGLRTDAIEVTADLAGLSAAVADGLTQPAGSRSGRTPALAGDASTRVPEGHSLPIDLEVEGFVRLSTEYFDAHDQAAPAVSWRTGFTLAEIHAGHAVDRLDDEGRNLTRQLLENAHDGADQIVLGPPGSGKSTVCMAVACEWYDQGLGPVLYRERGDGDHFESATLLEAYLRGTDGHALVVVEDAVRDEASSVFEVMQTLEADPSVTFLLDARLHEWRSPNAVELGTRLESYRRTAAEEITIPDLDERECERFVDHFGSLVDADVDLSGAELFAMVEEGTAGVGADSLPAGDALVAQHYLSRRYDPPVGVDASAVTALDETVRQTYRTLTDAEGRLALDLAVLTALLTAAGIPVAEEYLHAIADAEYDAVDEALSILDGRVLFDQERPRVGGPTTYRTRHETWAMRFLEQFCALEPPQRAREMVGRSVTRLLALADEPARRERIQHHLAGRTPFLHQIEADPRNWADELLERLFGIGRTNASLAPLFGETTEGTIELPAACSGSMRLQQAYWRGKMNLTYGDLDRAEREFRTLGDLAETAEFDDATVNRTLWRAKSRTNLGTVARERGEYATAEGYFTEALALFRETDDREGAAISLKDLGFAAYLRSDYDRAREYLERGLTIAKEIDAPAVEAASLDYLGLIAKDRSEYDRAREYLERSLAIKPELGARHGDALSLAALGMVAEEQGAYDEAREYLERSLTAHRDVGARHEVATCLNNIGVVARKQGDYEEAEEYHEQSLAIFRDLGTRHAEGASLKNLGVVARERGAYDEARESHERSLAINRELGDRQREAIARKNLGVVARLEGDHERARDHFDGALAALEGIQERDVSAEVRLEQGRLALTEGDIDTARERARQARESFEELGKTHWVGRSRRLLGRVAAAADAPAEAREHWRVALDTFETVGASQDALATLEELVETCRTEGDEAQAREWYQRARDLVADAPDPTAAQHRDWIERYTSELL